MYVEEIVSKRKGKEYRTLLVRESFREGATVSHRTLANISHLPQGCIEEIKRYLKGNLGNLDFSQVQVIDSKEYGASQSVLSLARKLGLDRLISSHKFQWREDVLVMIVGKLLYPGNEMFLTRVFADTILWESCGHPPNLQPEIYKNCYDSLSQLLSRKKNIQKKLQDKHLVKESVGLLFLTFTHIEEERELGEFSYFHDQARNNVFITALLTNTDGCPVAIEIFQFVVGEEAKNHQRIQQIIKKSKLETVVLVGDQNLFTCFASEMFSNITALTLNEINDFVKTNAIPPHVFSSNQFYEFVDPVNPLAHYILFVNKKRKKELGLARNELIKKAEESLLKIQKKNQNVLLEVEKIWKVFQNEEFFNWHIEKGKLHFFVNTSQIIKKEQLDGFSIIRTNVKNEVLTASEIVNAFGKLSKIQYHFRVIQTMTTKFCLISLENRVHAHAFLGMLSYYLQWHIEKKLESASKINEGIKIKRWTLKEVIERLKSIRSQTIRIGGITLGTVKTTLDADQCDIISVLGVTLVAKLLK